MLKIRPEIIYCDLNLAISAGCNGSVTRVPYIRGSGSSPHLCPGYLKHLEQRPAPNVTHVMGLITPPRYHTRFASFNLTVLKNFISLKDFVL